MKIYQENVRKYNTKVFSLKKDLNRISLVRLLIFLITGAIIITLFSINVITPIYIILPVSIISFGLVLNHHTKIAFLKKHSSFLKEINESEILREKCNLEEFETGQEFMDQNHPYTSDLDIFGQHSVFQLINRTTTESGRILLAEWLSKPASNTEISDRQTAIQELSQKLDWRQDFQAAGMHFKNKKSDYAQLLDWVKKPPVILKYRFLYTAAAAILPVLFLVFTYLFYTYLGSRTGMIYLSLMILIFIINLVILRKLSPLAEEIVETSTRNLHTLKGYESLIRKIENEGFTSKKLSALKSQLRHGHYSAYKEIHRICSLLDFSHQRPVRKNPIGGNGLYPLLNSFLLLDVHLIIGTEKWKSRNKEYLSSWADAVSEFEVLNSFAGFYYSNPAYTFPEISEKNNYVHFESMGHPLIDPVKRVCNDFRSNGPGDVVMVTGSNMGGKSTFLRTVGVNLVLGLAGAPCCTKYGQVANLEIFTSMRTQDNLMKGISSFYAELNRIEKMLILIHSSKNVFFLLDEMFKGTNSEDRHKGGYSLINQVSKLATSGIIATHDIELAKLAGDNKLVTNYSFNSEIKDESMVFSYELDPHVCKDFNASELMKKSGIKILPNISKSKII